MKKLFTLIILFSFFIGGFAQWSPTNMQGERTKSTSGQEEFFKLDIDLLRDQLSKAPRSGNYSNGVVITIPVLGGKLEKFKVYSEPVMVKELADQYQLGSYAGVGIDNPHKFIRFSLAPNDFQSMIIQPGTYEFIEPANADKTVYRVFPKTKPTGDQPFQCSMNEDLLSKKQIADLQKKGKSFNHNATDFSKNSDRKYRTLRLALSVTAEYTTYFGGVAGALTAMNATLTRVNGVFEKDFALRVILQNYPQLIYTNAATDPYSPAANMNNWNLELQNTLTSVVGNANYDIGHLFGATGGGGNAGCIGCICINPTTAVPRGKGSGYTSPANGIPQGDTFDIDYVAHEMGHQFGGNHTFSHNLEGAGTNMEPGSGSTIMGYAGITGPANNVQMNSDDYFHAISINQIQQNLIAKTCDIETNIANNPPVITGLQNYNIPKGTAFVLNATVTDPENNPMTFTWEQTDNAGVTINNANLGNTTSGASFRSVEPSTSTTRYFPRLSSVLAGVLNNSNNLWEAVPTVARTMNFTLTARDNHPTASEQQTQAGSLTLTVGNEGPFTVTSTTVYNNSAGAITWNVVNTNNAPYNVANVKIDYTTDNGATWTVIFNSTPNDGAENFQFTTLATGSTVKIRVSAINNVFYAIGTATVAAMQNCTGAAPTGVTVSGVTTNTATVNWPAAVGATYNIRYRVVGSPTWTNVNGLTTNSYLITGLTESTNYEVQVVYVCSGSPGTYSASVNFATPSLVYCNAASTNFDDEWISNVTVTPTAGTPMSSNSAGSFYTDYTTDPSRLINLVIGSNNNQLSVTKAWASTLYNEGVSAWIDFNRNGTFESTEQVLSSPPSQVTPVTATFNVPAGAYAGGQNTRMRVILTYNALPTDPCAGFQYGEVEDYAVLLIPQAPTCAGPSAVNASAITANSATISWTAATPAPANGYQYYISTTATAPTATTTPTGTTATTTVNLTGLNPYTTYYYWVRSSCSATDNSAWIAGTNFTTLQTPATLPYFQNFNGPNDFVFINGTQTNKWHYGAVVGNPANSIYISNDNGVSNAYTTSTTSVVHAYRDFIIPAGTTNATFSFDWKSVGENNYDYIRVWLVPATYTPNAGTQTTAGAGRIQVGSNFQLQAAWQNYFNPTLNISSFAGQTMRLIFEWRNDNSVGTNPPASIDNINLLIPTCQVPTALAFNTITSTSATITWTAANPVPANGYQYYLSTTNTPPTAATIPTGSTATTSVVLTGLLPNTQYFWWVRSKCAGTDASLWMTGPTFTTGQIPATLPYFQPFTTGPVDFTLLNGTQVNKWHYGSAEGNPPNSIYISNDNGVTNAYANNTSAVVHAYRDFIIPAGTTNATFAFDWKSIGENSFDYLRVWLVPVSFIPTPGTQITAGAGRIQVGTNYQGQATWQNYFNPALNLTTFANQTLRVVFEWRNDGIIGTNPPVSVDNVLLAIPTCQVPTALAVTNVLSTTATISWTAANPVPAAGYQYYISTTSTPPTATTVPTGSTTTTSVNLTGLTPNTTYYFWVRSKCVGTDVSFWMTGPSFTTAQIPATIPYVQPFTTGPVDFTFVNGTQTNKWFYGSAVGNAANSIYITNDGGVTNAYTNNSASVVHAYRDIVIPAGTTNLIFMFDWRAFGENNFDYLRVWLAPVSFVPVAGTQITAGAGRIQVGGNYGAQNTWQQYVNLNQNFSTFAGQTMRLIFSWRNDGIIGTNPPAALDNIRIVRCSNEPPVLTVTGITHNSATVTWPQDPGLATYILRYRPIGATNWTATIPVAAAPITSPNNSYLLQNLSPVTQYEVEVSAVCNNQAGAYSHIEFETKCDPAPVTSFTATNITSTSATLSWNPVLSAYYIIQWRPVGSATWNTISPVNTTTYTLTGLSPYVNYEVQVATYCSGAQNPFTTPLVFTTKPTCEMAPIGLTVTNITMTQAQVDWNAFPGATYVLRWRKVGFTSWTTVNLTANTYLLTGLTEQTQYEVQVANVCSGTTQAFTPPYIFTTPSVVYCDMEGQNSNFEHISNVTVKPFGGTEMNNNSGASGYTSYLDVPTKYILLTQGSTGNEISVSKKWTSTQFDESVTAWIDFNRDGIFSNSERILTTGPSKTTPVTGTFNVPADSFVTLSDMKYVVMRVAMKRGTPAAMCEDFEFGEVEDYKVLIVKPFNANVMNPNDINIYPNPVKNVLNVTLVQDGSKYTIYNAAGQLVQKGVIISNRLDVSNLINGVFIIDIEDKSGVRAQKKFIKE